MPKHRLTIKRTIEIHPPEPERRDSATGDGCLSALGKVLEFIANCIIWLCIIGTVIALFSKSR